MYFHIWLSTQTLGKDSTFKTNCDRWLKVDTVQQCWMDEIMEKRNEAPNGAKGPSSFKVGDTVVLESMVGVEGSPLLWTACDQTNNSKYCYQWK